MLVKDAIVSPPDTGKVVGLSRQIIAEMNLMIGNVLVNFEGLNNVVLQPSDHINAVLQPAAKESLRAAIKANSGKKLIVNSAYRTVAQQHILFQLHLQGSIALAAEPGFSNHEDGLALDIDNFDEWINVLEDHGWRWQNSNDPVHFSYLGAGVNDEIGAIGVKAFQHLWNKNNADQIAEDGDFGDETAKRMNRSPAEGFPVARLLKLVSPPMQGDDVRIAQQALLKAGMSLVVNGTFDQATDSAVRKFQELRKLSIDGVIGRQTRKALGI